MESEDITIKPADKGGGVVILDTKDCVEENLRLLGDTSTYQMLEKDPTLQFMERMRGLLEYGKERGIINEREFKYVRFPRVPVFYHLPKIHKKLQKPPGRPIISGIGSLTANLSEYVEHYLQGLVVCLKSYLKDSIQILNQLSDFKWEEDMFLVTADVTSLYTVIEHLQGCEAIQYSWQCTLF
ncbi:Hypothetical predicted protein [Pelobates cultripes]|uniref:Uncharacterized protein n=1 Tax=Pelobates cultripes TaxID=61616 RepID=A0AAD1SZA9_PELCU|nr:Hypothetical predicted protein [Pelobates cultripes]